jgi:ParD-like antitoxin of type II bacterial toxin-antitoxin system
MTVSIRINDTLYKQAKAEAKVEQRTIAGQIEHWAMVGRAALANPDLPVTFVAECLAALSESNEKLQPFVLGCKN